MPVFLVSAAFAERRVANSVKIFIDQWRQLETVLSRADRSILDSFDPASRGAFLYWLLNERALVCVARVIYSARLHAPCLAPFAMRWQWFRFLLELCST
jgi:hypothetical protein